MRHFQPAFLSGKYLGFPLPFILFLMQLLSWCHCFAGPGKLTGDRAVQGFVHNTDTGRTSPWFSSFFSANPELLRWISSRKKSHGIQLIYTRIDRGANGNAVLQSEYFDVDPGSRFDPGLGGALPLGVFSLKRMAELHDSVGIDKFTTMLTEAGNAGLTPAYNDPTTADGKPALANYLKRMLVAGDAGAYNRIFEFAGRQYVGKCLSALGYTQVHLPARIGGRFTAEQNRYSNPVVFYDDDLNVQYRIPSQYAASQTEGPGRKEEKNLAGIEDLHNMLVSLVFPNRFTREKRFDISAEDQGFLFHYMGLLPSESILPPYRDDTVRYFPCLRKLLYCGGSKGDTLSAGLRIFNVSDTANGRLLDVAYFADTTAKTEFFLSATVTRTPGTFLAEDPALDFLKGLGRAVYAMELKRPRRFPPNLKSYFSGYGGK
jgi:hypothetical protein